MSAALNNSLMAANQAESGNSVLSLIKELFKTRKHRNMHFLLSLLWIGSITNMFLAEFNSVELESGDPLTIGIVLSCTGIVGTLFSERFLALFSDHVALRVMAPATLLLSTLIKVPGIDVIMMYLILILQIFLIAGSYNLTLTLQETRTEAHLQAISLELNMCMGQLVSVLVPFITKAAEPIPTIAYWVTCLSTFIGVLFIGEKAKGANQSSLQHSLEHSIMSVILRDATIGEVTSRSLADGSILKVDGRKAKL